VFSPFFTNILCLKKLVKNIVEKIGEIRYLFSVSKKKI